MLNMLSSLNIEIIINFCSTILAALCKNKGAYQLRGWQGKRATDQPLSFRYIV